jgi:hypothetical protein
VLTTALVCSGSAYWERIALILTHPTLALPRWAYYGLSGATTLVGEVFHFHVAGARSRVDAVAGVVALVFWRDVAQRMV